MTPKALIERARAFNHNCDLDPRDYRGGPLMAELCLALESSLAENAKLREIAEIAAKLGTSGPCDGNRRTCKCGPCKLDRALEAWRQAGDET